MRGITTDVFIQRESYQSKEAIDRRFNMKSFKAGEKFGNYLSLIMREYKHIEEDDVCMSIFYVREELEQLFTEFDDDVEMLSMMSAFNEVIELWKEGGFKLQHKR